MEQPLTLPDERTAEQGGTHTLDMGEHSDLKGMSTWSLMRNSYC